MSEDIVERLPKTCPACGYDKIDEHWRIKTRGLDERPAQNAIGTYLCGTRLIVSIGGENTKNVAGAMYSYREVLSGCRKSVPWGALYDKGGE